MNEMIAIPGPSALVTIETLTPAIVFAPGNVDDLVGCIEREVRAVKTDISTPKGRAEIKSLAYKVARSKTALDGMGKELTDQWRKQADVVHVERRALIARLDALAEEIRWPLTEWENADKARIKGHETALETLIQHGSDIPESSSVIHRRLEALTAAIESGRDWQEFKSKASDAFAAAKDALEAALVRATRREAEIAELERLRAEQAERDRQEAVRQQQEREARIAAEAAAKARQEAEQRAERERQDTLRAAAEERARLAREAEEVAAATRAEQERAERQQRAAEARAQQAEMAHAEAVRQAEADRIAAAARADRDKRAAVQAEQQRVADAAAAEKAEAERRAANRAHQAKINREALADLIAAGLTEEVGKTAIAAIASGKVRHVAVRY